MVDEVRRFCPQAEAPLKACIALVMTSAGGLWLEAGGDGLVPKRGLFKQILIFAF